jgi:hypothetical protein
MNDRYLRYGAMTGIIAVVLIIIGFAAQPKPPAPNASPSEVLTYLVDHRDAVHVGELIFSAGAFFFLWFIGTLRSALGAAEGAQGRLATTAYGAGLVSVGTLFVGFGLQAAAALHPADNGADVTRALIDASAMVLALGAPALTVFFAANGLAIIRSGYLAPWLGWLALVTAVFNALGVGNVFSDHGVFASDGFLGFFAGLFLFLLWTLLASIMLVRKIGEGGTPRSATSTAAS